ncbi:MAG: K+ transport system NAD-binding component [Idiomarinaceae bacterium HL-53]|nr:MAG: K+ transport system NAD-binding component [Idiomarinaceae bacterium HL-53]CUS49158.1 Trk K+ transport system, NAD-binding component [Idiomarinaceae bacterium HL-53]
MIFKLRFIDRLKYYAERMLSGGAVAQLLFVALIVLLVAVSGGLLAYWVVPSEYRLTDEVWWSFLRLTDPGYLGDDQGLWRRVISTMLTLSGYVLFMGTLVAIMTQWLFRNMRNLEQGQTPVTFKEHHVILGWNSRTLPVIRELLTFSPKRGEGSRIAALAEDITEGPVNDLLAERWSTWTHRRVVLRSGSILNPEHLHRVAIANARTVIIPSRRNDADSSVSNDANVIKILVSLDAQTAHLDEKPAVVAELSDGGKIPVALHAYNGPLQIVPGDLMVARILARSALYPGLASTVNAILLDSDQSQIIPMQFSQFEGKTWREVFGYFEEVTPCGIVRKEHDRNKTMLAPPANEVIQAGDQILILAAQSDSKTPLSKPRRYVPSKHTERLLTGAAKVRKQILILGWNQSVPLLLKELGMEPESHYRVTMISTSAVEERKAKLERALPSNWPGTLEFVQGDYTDMSVLKKYRLEQFDNIMLFSSDRVGTGEEADARTVVGLMVLDYLLNKLPAQAERPHVLIELHDQSNEVYVNHANSDVIVSAVVISHVLAQVALYPPIRSVYDHLLSSLGAHLSIRYVPESMHRPMAVAELQQYVIAEGGVLIGVNPDGQQVRLNPETQEHVFCGPSTQLIVIMPDNPV